MKQVPPKIFNKKTGYFESFDGTPIYYEVRGEGRPIILSYGIVCLINHWHNQIKYFSQRYQTIAFDLRGHHSSGIPKNRDNLTVDAIAQDLKLLADHLKIEKASFWGHSFGSQFLIRAYDMYPELFHDLVFINGFATNPLNGMLGTDNINNIFQMIKQSYNVLPETMGYLWSRLANNALTMRFTALAGGFNLNLTSFKDVEIYAKGMSGIPVDVFLTLFEQMIQYSGAGVLERIECPTLIIAGSKDTVTPLQHQELLHNKIKGSEFMLVPYGTHCTQLDMPDLVNLRIEKFLNHNKYTPKKP